MSFNSDNECRKRSFQQDQSIKKIRNKPAPLDLSLVESQEHSGPSTPIITENPFLEDIIREEILFKDASMSSLSKNDKNILKIKMLLHAAEIKELPADDISSSILVLKEVAELRLFKYFN
jgi:hypothetical protein